MKFLWAVLLCTLQPATSQTFEVAETSIADLQKAMTEGRITSKALVQSYLNRIHAFDQKGPRLNAIITINPKALQEAEALDQERASKGPRGPLHGIPVIVKDNYGTTDMPTTAGTVALLGFKPSKEAFQVRKLREAGAIIIAKSNLHELASGITTTGSAFGQTRNPYDPTRHPGGSSGGTAAAIAASYAAVGMGSDTCASIRLPAAVNNLVGLRPTKGLSSIAGIVPLSVTQDTAGPLARSIADLAVVLDATIGEDSDDPATILPANQKRSTFADALNPTALKGTRIGVIESLFDTANDDPAVLRLIRASIEDMKKQGATIIPIPFTDLQQALDNTSVIALEFKEDLAGYLARYGPAPVQSLDQIVNQGLIHTSLTTVMQTRLTGKGRDSQEYKLALAKRAALQQLLLKIMSDEKLDAFLYPTMRRRLVPTGESQLGTTCQLSAFTGFPAITVPAGFTPDGLPVGVELLGRAFEDARLVALAYSYEQSTPHRRAPARTPALGNQLSAPVSTWQSSIQAPNTSSTLNAKMTLDPATGELAYELSATGFEQGEILAATIHRKTTGETGPVISVASNHDFKSHSGSFNLTDPERAALAKGDLYLRLATRSSTTNNLRLPLTNNTPKFCSIPPPTGLKTIPSADPWFTVYQLDASTFAIQEARQSERVISYLILGNKKALLFDTGFGIGRIDKVVKALTTLPITVLNSHSHYDHMGGNSMFKSILAMNSDYTKSKALGMPNSAAARFLNEQDVCGALPDGVTRQTYEIKPYKPTASISDNQIIDLGGRQLKILYTPGHSPDSITLHDPKTKTLFTGDTFYPGTLWLWVPETDLKAYRNSLTRLTRLVPQLDRLLTAHNTPQADPKILPKVLKALEQIEQGKADFQLSNNRRRYQFEGFGILLPNP